MPKDVGEKCVESTVFQIAGMNSLNPHWQLGKKVMWEGSDKYK